MRTAIETTRVILDVTTNPVDTLSAAGSAIATALAVVVALVIAIWGDDMKAWFRKPLLTLSIRPHAPDCHKIMTTGFNPQGWFALQYMSYFMRFAIGNDGRTAAKNVVVRALKLWCRAANGTYTEDPYFLPMNLIWSHSSTQTQPQGSVIASRIDPQLPRHCDLGHVDEGGGGLLTFCTEVKPNEVAPNVWPTVKPAGHYRLSVAVVADNADTRYYLVEIGWDGQWRDNETEMFRDGLVPTVISKALEKSPAGPMLSMREELTRT